MPAPNMSSTSACYFLTVPVEIRLAIYRQLLLPTQGCWLRSSSQDEYMEDQSQAEEDIDEPDDEEAAEDDVDRASNNLDEIDRMHGKGCQAFNTYKKHLAVLRTNRQIYSEAADLFYSELTVLLEPSNVESSENSFTPLEYGGNGHVWRHDPLLGIGDEGENNQHVYSSPSLDGFIEPHVFARLRNISFHAMFVIPQTNFPFIHEDLSIGKDDEDKWAEYTGQTTIMRTFVKIMSLCSTITRLNIRLGLQVNPLFLGITLSDFPYLSNDDFEKLRFAHDSRYIIAARRRATELFTASGALDPLYALDNVKCFNFEFMKEEGEEELPQKLLDMAQDMKISVERRYSAG